jgi:hypothetical protein
MCRLTNVENIVDAVIIIRYNTVTRYAVKLYSRKKKCFLFGVVAATVHVRRLLPLCTYTIVFLSLPIFRECHRVFYFILFYLFFFFSYFCVCVCENAGKKKIPKSFLGILCFYEFLKGIFYFHWNYDSVYFILFFLKKYSRI